MPQIQPPPRAHMETQARLLTPILDSKHAPVSTTNSDSSGDPVAIKTLRSYDSNRNSFQPPPPAHVDTHTHPNP